MWQSNRFLMHLTLNRERLLGSSVSFCSNLQIWQIQGMAIPAIRVSNILKAKLDMVVLRLKTQLNYLSVRNSSRRKDGLEHRTIMLFTSPTTRKRKSGLDVFSFLHQGKKGLHLHCLCLQALWTLCVYSMDGMNLTVGRYESIGKR